MLFGVSGVRNLIILQYLDRLDFKKVLWRLNVNRSLMTCKLLGMVMVFKCHFQQYFSYSLAVSFISGQTGIHEENHRPAASH